MRNVIIFLGALSTAACAGATPAAAPATPTERDTPATSTPTEEATPAPEAPAPVVDSEPAAPGAAASAPRELLLSAVCTSSTKKKCAADDPCCNVCTAMHWEPAQSENLTTADGKPYTLAGSPLPECKWPRGQCKCPFDLRARGQLTNNTFVVESFEQTPNAQ